MYYRLKNQFRLRGWDHLETGVTDGDTNMIFFLQPKNYSLLLRCNGNLDSNGVMFSDEDRKVLAELEKAGLLEASSEPLPPLDSIQNYIRYHNRMVRDAHWSITGGCNYRCRHCYMSAPHGKLPIMSREQWEDTVRQLAECGIQSVSLTGGEPLTHPDFWDIVDLLLANHITVSKIYSNGFLINDLFFRECTARNFRPSLSLSFDGVNGAHEWLRNTPCADSHIDSALRLAQEHGFQVDVEYCLYGKSAAILRESMLYLQKYGVTDVKINQLSLTGEGSGLSEELISTDEMYEMLPDFIRWYRAEGISMHIFWCGIFLTPQGIKYFFDKNLREKQVENYCLCGHARNSMYITSEGRILPCIPYSENPEIMEDFETLFDTPLQKLLSDSMYFRIINMTLPEYLANNSECNACEYKYHCAGGCRGNALSENAACVHGNDSKCINHFLTDRTVCHFFRSGIKERIDAVAAETFRDSHTT